MIEEKSGLVSLSNNVAECKISLFGANIISYRPKGEKHDVFWLGDLNKFDNIHAIRGGVPVCWPRFAEEKLNDNLPRHGFARLSMWEIKSIVVENEKIEVELFLKPDVKYNVDVEAKLFIKITDKLEFSLETINNGHEIFKFSEALHSYFNVSDRDEIKIKNLQGYKYKSSLDNKIYELKDDLIINSEFDATFFEHNGSVEIEDKTFNRAIVLEKTNSKSTVVWNPDKDLVEMSSGQYKNFICVEPANQGDNFVTLAPKERHKITMSVGVRKLEV